MRKKVQHATEPPLTFLEGFLPVPKLMSTKSSKTIGIFRSQKGCSTIFPFRCWYLGSAGWTATAVSPNMVSIRVVATITSSSENRRSRGLLSQQNFIKMFCRRSHTWSLHFVGKRHQDPKLHFIFVTGHRQQSPARKLLFIHLEDNFMIPSGKDTKSRTN